MPLLKAKIGHHVVSRVDIEHVCEMRLLNWKELLIRNESTPFALFSICHNHRNEQINVWVCDEISRQEMALILRSTADELDP